MHLQAVLIGDDEIIAVGAVILLRFQVEAAPEGALLPVLAGLVRDDLLHIADGFAAAVSKSKLIGCRLPVAAHSVLLVEVQGEDHVADLPA